MVVTVSVRDARALDDRRWIQGVYRDYLDDLAPDTGVFPVLGEVLRFFDQHLASVPENCIDAGLAAVPKTCAG